jgi:hypothetical protein
MFEIDLLNGQGLPVKSQPWAVALVAAPFLIPLVAIVVLISSYVTDGMEIRSKQEQTVKMDVKLAEMTTARAERDMSQAQIVAAAKSSQEIALSVKGRMQWSDVVSEISNHRPGDLVLYKISANREKVTTKPDESGKTMSSYKFKMMMGAYADIGSTGGASVRQFIDSVKSSTVLGPRIESIKPISNQSGTFQGRNVAVYDIECIFKANQ